MPKTYVHLYPENPIRMNWDIPTERFNGMTPYEVCKKQGFPAHKSQYKGFAGYFAGRETADSIRENSPCEYGLYRSTVGADVQKDDLFENLICRKERKLQEEAEEKARRAELEQEKKRLEAEQRQKEAEEKARQEAQQEAERIAREEQILADQARQRKMEMILGFCAAGLLAAVALLTVLIVKLRK